MSPCLYNGGEGCSNKVTTVSLGGEYVRKKKKIKKRNRAKSSSAGCISSMVVLRAAEAESSGFSSMASSERSGVFGRGVR